MKPDWQARVKELVLAAQGQLPDKRRDFLDQACAEDAELRREVESLLLEHDRQGFATEADMAVDEESPAPANDSLVGASLGRYKILGLVGKGGMAAV
ncbi:MAG: hypothetical protein OES47_13850, partial [Acidobacteriota bacterium]|nr:hypothetical protein [Acidobacteriota bacterium]